MCSTFFFFFLLQTKRYGHFSHIALLSCLKKKKKQREIELKGRGVMRVTFLGVGGRYFPPFMFLRQ
jgi:hypothetical protein